MDIMVLFAKLSMFRLLFRSWHQLFRSHEIFKGIHVSICCFYVLLNFSIWIEFVYWNKHISTVYQSKTICFFCCHISSPISFIRLCYLYFNFFDCLLFFASPLLLLVFISNSAGMNARHSKIVTYIYCREKNNTYLNVLYLELLCVHHEYERCIHELKSSINIYMYQS